MKLNEGGTSVFLNVYDFTTLNTCLKIFGMSGYHCGIEIKYKSKQRSDLQYCFCVVDSNPKVSGVITIQPQSAQYRFNRKLYLGSTDLSEDQIEDIIDELSKKYTCGKYHMFKFNCNHFCDELSNLIVGSGIPSWIFSTTNCLKYICCCLPDGLVSGLWAIQSLEDQIAREQASLLRPYKK